MRVNMQLNTTSYRKNYKQTGMFTQKQETDIKHADVTGGRISLKRMLTDAGKEQKNPFAIKNNNIITASMSYSDRLRAQRDNLKKATLEKKKLKYQFKDISSKIIRSKTSQSARQAVSSARREILRLKQEKQSGKYDPEEIEAAITHAKAMERAARKKVRHLEEEEMVKAAGGICADLEIEREETVDEGEETAENELEMPEGLDEADILPQEDFEEEISEEDMAAMLEQMEDFATEFMDEMEEGMRDMLEEMGFGELSESTAAAKGDMDPEDFKMMKIKHRCKEMKEITKADSEYLKAVFEHLEKMQDSGGSAMATPSADMAPVATNAMPIPEVTIDISI